MGFNMKHKGAMCCWNNLANVVYYVDGQLMHHHSKTIVHIFTATLLTI